MDHLFAHAAATSVSWVRSYIHIFIAEHTPNAQDLEALGSIRTHQKIVVHIYLWLMEIQQLDFEAERSARRNIRWCATIAICCRGGTYDLRLLAFLHLLQCFGPA